MTATEMWQHLSKQYRVNLKDSPRAIDYLKGHGVTGPAAVHLRIGYDVDSDSLMVPSLDRFGLVTGFACQPIAMCPGDRGGCMGDCIYCCLRNAKPKPPKPRPLPPIRRPRGRGKRGR